MPNFTLISGKWEAATGWVLWNAAHNASGSPKLQAAFGEAELPPGTEPSPWLRVDAFTGARPDPLDTILGIQVDITAFNSDTDSQTKDSTVLTNVDWDTLLQSQAKDLMLVLDYSGTMHLAWDTFPTTTYPNDTDGKIGAVKQMAGSLADAVYLAQGSRVGLITFDRPLDADPGYRLVQGYTSDSAVFHAALAASNMVADGETHMRGGLNLARAYAEANAEQQVSIALLSDSSYTDLSLDDGDPTGDMAAMIAAHPDWLLFVGDLIMPGDDLDPGYHHGVMDNIGSVIGSGYFPMLTMADFQAMLDAIAPQTLDPLEIALSLDGVHPVGETWAIFTTGSSTTKTAGLATYTWNKPGGWQSHDFSDQFSVLIRRPAPRTAVSSQYVTAARVRLASKSPEGTMSGTTVRQELTELVLLGAEDTPGSISTSFKRMRSLNYKLRPNANMKRFKPQGEKLAAVNVPTREWSTGSISGLLDYNELPVALEAAIEPGVHGGAATINQRNTHTYTLSNRVASDRKTYSLQRGQQGLRAQQGLYLIHNGLQIQINTTDCQVSGTFFAQVMTDGITLANGVTAVQTMTISGTPSSGGYKLSYKGKQTTLLAYGANAAAIQTALQALSTIGAGNILVTGTGPFVFTFAGALAHTKVPLITVWANTTDTGTFVIADTTPGGWPEYPLVPVLPGHWSIYMADTQAGLDAGKLTKAIGVAATGFDIGNRHAPFWVLDRDLAGTFADSVEVDPTFKSNLTVGANSTGMSLLSNIRAGQKKWFRMEAFGPPIGVTTDLHKIIVEGPVQVSDFADFGDEEGRVVFPWPLEWCEGDDGEVPILVVENGIVSY